MRNLALIAVLAVWNIASAAHAEVFLTRSDKELRIVVPDPFSQKAMKTLASINQTANAFDGDPSPMLSIENVISQTTYEHPEYGTSFWTTRSFNFDMGLIADRFDSYLEKFRKNGCSKVKISSPKIVQLKPHEAVYHVDVSYKFRACDDWLGTHDVAKGNGFIRVAAKLVDKGGYPQIEIEQRESALDMDEVFGLNVNSFFGGIVKILTVDVATVFGAVDHVRGSVGELQFSMSHPIREFNRARAELRTTSEYSSSEISAMTRGYGSLSKMLGNASARRLKFSLADSSMLRRNRSSVRSEHASDKTDRFCEEIRQDNLGPYYCVPALGYRPILQVVQKYSYAEDSRAVIENVYRDEAVLLSSLSDNEELKFYQSHVQLARIIDEIYLDRLFGAFFKSNNRNVKCGTDLSPGRPRSTGETWCGYRIVPAWKMAFPDRSFDDD